MLVKDVSKISMRDFSKRDMIVNGEILSIEGVEIVASGCLQRIADALEKIERHMAFNNGTLEGLTRNYDPNLNRR